MLPSSFLFVRHGETDWNRNGVLQGFTDIPLNDHGRAQAHAAIAVLRDQPIDRIVASPLSRARETAEIFNTALRKPLSLHDGLRERHFGDFEGRTSDEINRLRRDMLAHGVAAEENGSPCPPDGESYADFKARIFAAFADEMAATPGQRILFVCHGGVYRVLRLSLLGSVTQSPNVAPYWFEKNNNAWSLRAL